VGSGVGVAVGVGVDVTVGVAVAVGVSVGVGVRVGEAAPITPQPLSATQPSVEQRMKAARDGAWRGTHAVYRRRRARRSVDGRS